MRIGLFGGTFNPIHNGHIQVSREVRERFCLDSIYLIPAASPPHKKNHEIAPAPDRLRMTHLAVSGQEGFLVSDVELTRSGPSYTIDTLHHFAEILPDGTESYLLLGMDAFLEIDTWRYYRELFAILPVIVMSRPGTSQTDVNRLQRFIQNKIAEGYLLSEAENGFHHPTNKAIYIVAVKPYDISSTIIRRMIQKRQPINNLVAKDVEQYIYEKGLYL